MVYACAGSLSVAKAIDRCIWVAFVAMTIGIILVAQNVHEVFWPYFFAFMAVSTAWLALCTSPMPKPRCGSDAQSEPGTVFDWDETAQLSTIVSGALQEEVRSLNIKNEGNLPLRIDGG